MKVAIYGQYYKSNAVDFVDNLLKILEDNNVETIIEVQFFSLLSTKKKYATFSHYSDLDNSFDIMLTVGGDGTFLRAVTYVKDSNIPILGINTGRLGFLATVNKEDIENVIKAIFNKEYTIKERSLLAIKTTDDDLKLHGLNFALNEVTVARKNTTSMITIETHLDNEYLTSYWADGLIISTPTGSTGYSLSCGGPVITPQAKSLVLTPIAPHNLNARPLVIPDTTKIELTISSREERALLSLDSRILDVKNGTKVTITKASFTIKTIQLTQQTFLKTLREKLLWGEDKRN